VSTFASDLLVALGIVFLPYYQSILLGSPFALILAYLVPSRYLLIRGARVQEGAALWNMTAMYIRLIGACLSRANSDLISQILAVSIPLAIMAVSYSQRRIWPLVIALLAFCTNCTSFISQILEAVVDYKWSILMLSGIGLIFGASYVEIAIRRFNAHWVNPDKQ
jgi:hypothetical protein